MKKNQKNLRLFSVNLLQVVNTVKETPAFAKAVNNLTSVNHLKLKLIREWAFAKQTGLSFLCLLTQLCQEHKIAKHQLKQVLIEEHIKQEKRDIPS